MSILQKADRLGRRGNRFESSRAQLFGHGRSRHVFAAGYFIAFPHRFRSLDRNYLFAVDLGAIFLVGEDSGFSWINTGGDSRAVHVRRTRINRMMMSKYDAFLRQFPK